MTDTAPILFDFFRLDPQDMSVWKQDERVALTPKAFAVLRHLVRHPARLVTKEELFAAVWAETIVSDATLASCIKEIRRVLDDHSRPPRFIETVYKQGFRFIAPIHATPHTVASSQYSGVRRDEDKAEGEVAFPVPPPQPPLPLLIGRDMELAQLHKWLEDAVRGERRVVFITGSPGIGKTTVTEAFLRHAALNRDLWVTGGQCVEHYGTSEAYLPVLDALDRLCRAPDGHRVMAILDQHAPTWLVQMPALLNLADRERLQRQLVGVTRERMLREIADALEMLARERPLVLWLEDLQWSDYSTLDLFSFLARRRQPARLLLLGTYRPVDIILGGHPLKGLKQELQTHRLCVEVPLNLLSASDVGAYLTTQFAMSAFAATLAPVIHRRTEGNPLFMVNVVEHLQAQRIVVEQHGQWTLHGEVAAVESAVPENLLAMIAQQVDRLDLQAQRILEVASLTGSQFSAAEVAAAIGVDVTIIEEHCEALMRQGRFLRTRGLDTWPDGTVAARYEFVHALYGDVLSRRVSESQRIRLHLRLGEQLERAYGARSAEVASELARHFELGRDYQRAVIYLRHVAESATHRSANREAYDALTKALRLLDTLPESPERGRQELALQTSLGPILIATKGNATPDVERVYARARALCEQSGDPTQLFPVVFGLRSFYLMWGEVQAAHALGQELVQIAEKAQNDDFLLEAHVALASTFFFLGEFSACRTHAEAGIDLYRQEQHRAHVALYGLDPGVFCHCRAGQILWMQGYPNQARQQEQTGLALARALDHPYSLAFALQNAAWVQLFCGDGPTAQLLSQEGIALAEQHGFPFLLAWGTLQHGWALTMQGRGVDGIAQMHAGLAAPIPTAKATRSYLQTLLVEAYSAQGHTADGLRTLAEVMEVGQRSGERFLEAERYRLKGELMRQQENQKAPVKKQKIKSPTPTSQTPEPQAEACFRKAIDIARQQQAKSLELRAIMSLARLHHDQASRLASRHTQLAARSTRAEIHKMLSEVYNWFTEGLDTADLREAKTLRDALCR